MTHPDPSFLPPRWLRPAAVQTVLASARRRQRLHAAFDAAATRIDLSAGQDLYSPAFINTPDAPKGRVVLLHGWLGTPQAGYVLSTAAALYQAGFETVRLTLPDHGDAALMSPRVVDLTRHDFIAAALRSFEAAQGTKPFGLVGFSLGGSFTLRVMRDYPQGIAFALGISPLVSPKETSARIDSSPLIRRYFLRKFQRLARDKGRVFPQIDGLDALQRVRNIDGITTVSVARHTDYASVDEYYAAYRIGTSDLAQSQVPLVMLLSQDDPIVPSDYALDLTLGPNARKILTRHGGHNGFFDSFPHGAYGDRLAVEMAETYLA